MQTTTYVPNLNTSFGTRDINLSTGFFPVFRDPPSRGLLGGHGKGRLPGEQLEEQDPQSPEVHALVVGLTEEHLRRHLPLCRWKHNKMRLESWLKNM